MVRDDSYKRLVSVLEPLLAAEGTAALHDRIVTGAGELVPHDSVRLYEADARAGEQVLRRVGAALKDRLRLGDLAGRLGGDEFVVLLPQTCAAGAAVIARELDTAIAAASSGVEGRVAGLSASVGFAQLEATESPEALLARVDRLMYRAKRR